MDLYSTASFLLFLFSGGVSVALVSYIGAKGIAKAVRGGKKEGTKIEKEVVEEIKAAENRQFRDVHFKKVMIVITKPFGGIRVPVHVAVVSTAKQFYYWGKGQDRGAYCVLTEFVTLVLKLPILLFDVTVTTPLKVHIKDSEGVDINSIHKPMVIGTEYQFSAMVDIYIEKEVIRQVAEAAMKPEAAPDSRLMKTILITGILVGVVTFFMGWFFGSVVPVTNFIHFNSTKSAVIILGGLI